MRAIDGAAPFPTRLRPGFSFFLTAGGRDGASGGQMGMLQAGLARHDEPMAHTADRVILFVDLRGSTSLYLQLGNAPAASVVTQSLGLLGQIISRTGGRVVKSLGDGLMAVFDDAAAAVAVADEMHESLDRIVELPTSPGARHTALKLKVALAWGEVVDLQGDCFGDAVNVAARLLDLAGESETLATASLLDQLPVADQARFRRLERLHLRGRNEPVLVHRLEGRRFGDTASTLFEDAAVSTPPEGLRLSWGDDCRLFGADTPVIILGRSPQATFCLDDSRVSRSHARIECHGGHFQLTDLSYNGTYVRFAAEEQPMALRRGSCALHGSGWIGLGAPPNDGQAAVLRFEVLTFEETEPRGL